MEDIETMIVLQCHLKMDYASGLEKVQKLIDLKLKKLFL